jgi:chemotaxis signal transduction protein
MLLELDGHRVGVVVDAARELVRVDSTTISAPRRWSVAWRALHRRHPGPARSHIVILNAQRLLADDERNVLHTWRSRRE